ncbi:MAG TPA: alkaline phosphatase family protein [Mycobacteriales bacterium]|nr:alkaline phosphatase family protein [Mycobacteriales bacterium]
MAPTTTHPAPHVMVIVEENHSYDEIIGNPAMPFLNSLANTYGLATNYVGVSHPSEPNYLAMISGSIWNNPQDRTPGDGTYSAPTVVDQLAANGIGWKAYLEDMPAACDLTGTYGPDGYDVNHNPFMYFDRIRNSPAQCGRDVPFTQFSTDLKSGLAPPFIFVAPNTTNDMHDGTYQQGDGWLAQQFKEILSSTWYRQGGIVVVTFDEGETSDRVATVVVSAANRGAPRLAAPTNHYGLLRGIEETYGLPLLGAAGSSVNGDLKPLLTP